jgi:hypothetical protein
VPLEILGSVLEQGHQTEAQGFANQARLVDPLLRCHRERLQIAASIDAGHPRRDDEAPLVKPLSLTLPPGQCPADEQIGTIERIARADLLQRSLFKAFFEQNFG